MGSFRDDPAARVAGREKLKRLFDQDLPNGTNGMSDGPDLHARLVDQPPVKGGHGDGKSGSQDANRARYARLTKATDDRSQLKFPKAEDPLAG
jgi:hypothetical protein